MKSRILPALCVSLLLVGCAGESADENMDADAAAESTDAMASTATDADMAAIDQIRMDYVEHYNMHHPEVVAEMYDDSAVVLGATGSVEEGKDAILAGMQEFMAMSPTLDLTRRETRVFGDYATAIGDYSLAGTSPEGAIAATGHYLTGFQRIDGEWKIIGVVTNYDTAPPEGMPVAEDEGEEPPPENGTMTDLITAYETHFNLGHADMVADLFTDDATVAFANLPIGTGRAAVVSALEQRFAMGDSPQIDIHDVYTMELGDGWAIDAGWYEITAGSAGQAGSYISLAQQQADGSWKMHWMVSNGQPMGG